MLFDQGKLAKITFRAFEASGENKEPTELSTNPKDTYVARVNPSSVSVSRAHRYANRRGQGASGSDAVYSGSDATSLRFELLFDGTGVIPPSSELGDVPLVGAIASALAGSEEEVDVWTELQKFKYVVYDYDGKIHRPRKVRLSWGRLIYDVALTSFGCRFTLFKANGHPLRAIVTCSFRGWQIDAQRALEEDNTSPDLTHVREVQAGDTLPLMAHRIYGDAGLYLEVARVNKLVDFRRLRIGTRITLPPIDKGSGKESAT